MIKLLSEVRKQHLALVARIPDPQVGYQVLQKCWGFSKAVLYLRTVPPVRLGDWFDEYQDEMYKVIQDIVFRPFRSNSHSEIKKVRHFFFP